MNQANKRVTQRNLRINRGTKIRAERQADETQGQNVLLDIPDRSNPL